MKKLISQKKAIIVMKTLLVTLIVFHTLVLTKIIPYATVWAGKINSDTEMKKLEEISICLTVIALLILVVKGGCIRHKITDKIVNSIIWTLVVFFSLNTIGNLFAKTKFELYFFTPLTFISAILCLRIVMETKPK